MGFKKGLLLQMLAGAMLHDPFNAEMMALESEVKATAKPEPVVVTPQTKEGMVKWMKENFTKLTGKVNEWNASCSTKLKEQWVEENVMLYGTTMKNAQKRWKKFRGECLFDTKVTADGYLERIDRIENPDKYKVEGEKSTHEFYKDLFKKED